MAQVGIELNGAFYADGTTAIIDCGTQYLYARVKDGNLHRFCNGVIIQPPGWTFIGNDSNDKCPNFQTTTTTGGTLRIQYVYSLNGQANYVEIHIERPVPSNFDIVGFSNICSGETKTFSINNPPPGSINWTIGSNLNLGSNGNTSTQISYAGDGNSFVTATVNTSNGCGVVSRTKNVYVGAPTLQVMTYGT